MKSLLKQTALIAIACLFFLAGFCQVKRVATIGITVKDMPSAVKFYTEVLGFKKVSDTERTGEVYERLEGIFGLHMRVVRMQLGDEFIELTDYLTAGGRNIPEDMHSNDLAFQHIAIVVSDMDKAYAHLRKYNVEHISTSPQTLPASIAPAAGVKAFYFHDQDNHSLELIYFPKGKGQPKWQQNNGNIFLGIDHTAIGISNTDNSLHFYQDILGIVRKGDSWNKGIEQEHLNNVEGASLHITGLRTAAGPGIEFLQYIQPGVGKPYPADTRADDIWYWQTELIVDDAQSVYNRLQADGYRFVSNGIVEMNDRRHSKAFIVKDPDGHAMLVRGE
ncbi:MAG: VOC family protein [Bacteroidetes bacterium]|nr:VOC family protein [Bacteroidota bacterium]